MLRYLLRRALYAPLVLLGVNILTFALFFIVNTPDDMARMQLGAKRVTPEAIELWKAERGYNKPLVFNAGASGVEKLTDTVFVRKSLSMFVLQFGRSDTGQDIGREILTRMGPSLAIAVPTFLLSLVLNITFALLFLLLRGSRLDFAGVVLCVAGMSISALFYIVAGQWLFAVSARWVPISGYAPGLDGLRFLLLPIFVSVLAGLSSGVRVYRTFFLEELSRDYVRTARAKGLSEIKILFGHVLKNAMIPILTGVVVVIPSLFMGSLLIESFFSIPGLGSYTIEAIQAQDFAVVRTMVFIGSAMYIIGLWLTDISYTLVDPRVRLS